MLTKLGAGMLGFGLGMLCPAGGDRGRQPHGGVELGGVLVACIGFDLLLLGAVLHALRGPE